MLPGDDQRERPGFLRRACRLARRPGARVESRGVAGRAGRGASAASRSEGIALPKHLSDLGLGPYCNPAPSVRYWLQATRGGTVVSLTPRVAAGTALTHEEPRELSANVASRLTAPPLPCTEATHA